MRFMVNVVDEKTKHRWAEILEQTAIPANGGGYCTKPVICAVLGKPSDNDVIERMNAIARQLNELVDVISA